MSYYIVGIGGTGAKCVEALVHVAAAGLLKQSVSVLLVDPDIANGSLDRSIKTLDAYEEARHVISESHFIQVLIKPTTPRVWTPFEDELEPVFQDKFQYELLKDRQPAAAGLMDVLYSRQEKTASLKKGFLGRPSIGAAVLADSIDKSARPWKDFCSEINTDPSARVFLMGSIFGGTGAAGLPTIAKLLREWFKDKQSAQFRLGCLLMLPYFSFQSANDQEQLQARPEEFLLRSQAALDYYQTKQDQQAIYDAVYLLGSDTQASMGEHHLGAGPQRNPPHYLELYAATAAVHFFEHNTDQEVKTYLIARNRGPVNWESFPDGKGVFKWNFVNLTRFAYAYLSYFYPKLQTQLVNRSALKSTTWFRRFFQGEISQSAENELKQLVDYCRRLLIWLAEVHGVEDELKVNLFNTRIYQVTANQELLFGNLSVSYPELTRPAQLQLNPTLEEISKALDRYDPRQMPGTSGVSKFLNALHQECRAK